MFDVGGGELLLIVLAILVLFGPEKLPEIAQMFGKGMSKVKQAQAQLQNQLSDIQKDFTKATDISEISNLGIQTDYLVQNPEMTNLGHSNKQSEFQTEYIPPEYANTNDYNNSIEQNQTDFVSKIESDNHPTNETNEIPETPKESNSTNKNI